jgi:hypothetical protein
LATDRFRVRPTAFGKLCTVGQVVMVAFVLTAPDLNYLRAGLGTWMAGTMADVVAVLCLLAGISYTRLGLAFIAEGQKPLEHHGANSTGATDTHERH